MKLKKSFIALLSLFILFSPLLSLMPVSAAEDTSLQDIKDKGKLVIGTSADYPPYEFHAMVDGKDTIVGADVMLAEKIAADIGVTVEFKDMDFDGLLLALETGKVDMIIAGMVPTDERRKSVDFSQIYYEELQYMVVRAEDKDKYQTIDDLKGEKIGAQKTTTQEDVARDQVEDATIKSLSKIPDLMVSLKTKKVNAIVLSRPVAKSYADADSAIVAIDPGFESTGQNPAIAVRKGSGTLLEQVNTTLDGLIANDEINGFFTEAEKYQEISVDEESNTASDAQKTPMTNYWSYFAKGTGYTVLIAFISVIAGSLLGLVLALLRLSPKKILRIPATAYVEFVRGTPMMIQVMFVYYGLGYIINLPELAAGILAVTLNSGAYVCEIFRSGIKSVPSGQTEAARSLGMDNKTSMRYIIIPQALKNIWPALGNEFISVIKESSVVSIIGVGELIFQTSVVRGVTYRAIAPIVITMVIYFILTFSLTKLLNYFERKMNHA